MFKLTNTTEQQRKMNFSICKLILNKKIIIFYSVNIVYSFE